MISVTYANEVYGLKMTRFQGLGFMRIDSTCWRFVYVDLGEASPIGPFYRTKGELLADLQRFADERGFA